MCISEDLDNRPDESRSLPDSIHDRHLSLHLIDRSTAHIFVLAMPDGDEPANLIQSVSMELERLTTLMDHGLKRHQDVMLLAQNGLTDCIAEEGIPVPGEALPRRLLRQRDHPAARAEGRVRRTRRWPASGGDRPDVLGAGVPYDFSNGDGAPLLHETTSRHHTITAPDRLIHSNSESDSR